MGNDANRYPRRSDRDRYSRQQEQFEDSSWRDDDRRQMGDFRERDEYGQSDSQFERGGQSYRERDNDRARYETYSTGQEGYSSGGYGAKRYTPGGGRSFASFTGNDYGGADFSGGTGTYGHERTGASGYGRSSYGGGEWGAGSYGAGSWLGANHGEWRDRDFAQGRGYARDRQYARGGDDRGFFERAGDAVARWFGDDDGSDYGRRRENYRGHGPSNYTRTDERIREDASERLTDDWSVDARNIEVKVSGGEITLDGTVRTRDQKRRAEDLVEDLSGVKHVQNNLRVDEGSAWDRNNSGTTTGSTANKTTSST